MLMDAQVNPFPNHNLHDPNHDLIPTATCTLPLYLYLYLYLYLSLTIGKLTATIVRSNN